MPPLRRHQLAHLSAAGWSEVLSRRWDATARECLHHWAQRRLPLVVTRGMDHPRSAFGGLAGRARPGTVWPLARHEQSAGTVRVRARPPQGGDTGGPAKPDPRCLLGCVGSCDGDIVALGLPAPQAWARRRIALQVPCDTIAWLDEFPRAADVLRLLPAHARRPVHELLEGLASLGVQARVYGSHGWQLISGQRYLHADSDLDLWLTVQDPLQADAAAHRLQSMSLARPRLDGELVFVDGAAVAWREWATWRAGRTRGLLVKRLSGATIEHRLAMPGAVVAA
jgi:phosphoribosyl-dephospho-CoA transferase